RIWHNWRRGTTEGVPGLMLFLWAVCMAPFGAYSIIQNFNIPIQTQPQIFCFLCLICWAQTLVYHNKFKIWQATLITLVTMTVFGGLEVVLVLTLRGPYSRGVEWPITLIGVVAVVLFVLGLIPPYFEIWKRRGRVVGLNFMFLAIDWSGALFSMLALAVQRSFDVIGGVSYICVLVLEIGIVSSHLVWLYRTRNVREAAKRAGKKYDEYVLETQNADTSVSGEEKEMDVEAQFARSERSEENRVGEEKEMDVEAQVAGGERAQGRTGEGPAGDKKEQG
ncbi:hypothetical protein EJ06DRAFT_480605, partial [Trichodelitschia bisporula]